MRKTQGDSKKQACDDCDGLGAVFAEVLAGFWDRLAARADQGEDEVADRGERTATRTDAAAILVIDTSRT